MRGIEESTLEEKSLVLIKLRDQISCTTSVNQYKNYLQNYIYKNAMHVKKIEQFETKLGKIEKMRMKVCTEK